MKGWSILAAVILAGCAGWRGPLWSEAERITFWVYSGGVGDAAAHAAGVDFQVAAQLQSALQREGVFRLATNPVLRVVVEVTAYREPTLAGQVDSSGTVSSVNLPGLVGVLASVTNRVSGQAETYFGSAALPPGSEGVTLDAIREVTTQLARQIRLGFGPAVPERSGHSQR